MIVRRRRTKNFTILENEVFDDERLSLEAMALLAWLRSRPNDWALSVEQLRARFKVGINKMHNLVRELVDLGWVTRERKRDPVTKSFVGMEYVVLDEATVPTSGADDEEPSHENHDVAQAAFPLCADPRHDLPDVANHDDVIRTESHQGLDSHTPLPPQQRPEEAVCGSILDQVKIRPVAPEPPPARWCDLEAIWPWEEGESRIQAEARFEALDRPTRRHVLVAAPTYLRSREVSKRKRSHLKTFIEEQLFRDYPADGEAPAPRPRQVFVAVGTREFAAWDQAYRAAGRPGMPSASRHEGRQGWWRPSLFPAQDWSYEREQQAAQARAGPGAAA